MQHVPWHGQDQKLAGERIPEVTLDDLSRTEIEWLINEYIHNERDRGILRRRLLDGIRFEPLAEEFDMSVRQTKNIVYRGEEKIFKRFLGRFL